MKKIIALILLAFNAYSIDLIIHDPCEKGKYELISFHMLEPMQMSDLTFNLFDDHGIPYISAYNGIRSIQNTPYGEDAIFIQDMQNMKSYGWCYAVDGVQPNVTIDKFTVIPDTHKIIEWVFGMAEMRDGKWISYCTPVSEINDLDQGICAL